MKPRKTSLQHCCWSNSWHNGQIVLFIRFNYVLSCRYFSRLFVCFYITTIFPVPVKNELAQSKVANQNDNPFSCTMCHMYATTVLDNMDMSLVSSHAGALHTIRHNSRCLQSDVEHLALNECHSMGPFFESCQKVIQTYGAYVYMCIHAGQSSQTACKPACDWTADDDCNLTVCNVSYKLMSLKNVQLIRITDNKIRSSKLLHYEFLLRKTHRSGTDRLSFYRRCDQFHWDVKVRDRFFVLFFMPIYLFSTNLPLHAVFMSPFYILYTQLLPSVRRGIDLRACDTHCVQHVPISDQHCWIDGKLTGVL